MVWGMAAAAASQGEGSSQGPATDRHNEPVVDPTANVLALVAAETKRQDDLREMVTRHIEEIVALRADYDEKLREAEAKRIDAIRAVDVGAVNRAAEVAATQAATLAAQVATSAETLRNQVQAAATASTVALAAALEPIIKDIADLRRVQYEGVGSKTQVVETRAEGTETRGQSQLVLYALVAVFALLTLIATVYALTRPAQAAGAMFG